MADSWFPSLAGAELWTGPNDPETAARRVARAREVDVRLPNIIRAEWLRLTKDRPIAEIDPLEDPAGAVKALESEYGTLSDNPGFYNAQQYAQAGRDYALSQKSADAEDAYRQAQFLLPEERYQYMQQGPGRLVDVLSGLQREPAHGRDYGSYADEALTYWDQSNNARATREDYSNPNYQRFSSPDLGAGAFLGNPASPVSSYLELMSIVPKAILNRAESDSAMQALDQSGQRWGLRDHSVVTPEVEVLDIQPEQLAGMDADEARQAYFNRRTLLAGLHGDLQPPSYLNFANAAAHKLQDSFGNPQAWGAAPGIATPQAPARANVSQGTADTIGMFVDALDPSLMAGATAGIATKMAAPGASLGKAVAAESLEQGIPEAAFGGGLNAVTGVGGDGSYSDYWLTGKPSDPSRAAERERAATITAGLLRQSPQSVADERWKATPYGQQGTRYRSPSEVYPSAGR